MSITVGRAGRDVTLSDPTTFSLRGTTLTLGGYTDGLTGPDGAALWQQLSGLDGNRDEPEVPFEWPAMADLDGIYQPKSVALTGEKMTPVNGRFKWDLTLEQVPNCALPQLEHQLVGGLRTNSHAFTDADVTPWHAVPVEALDYWSGEATPTSSFDFTRSGEHGDVGIHLFGTGVSNDRLAHSSLRPAHWYSCGAQIEIGYPDATAYRVIAGRQLPGADASAVRSWRISNDLVRAYPHPTDDGVLVVAFWNGTTWVEVDWEFEGPALIDTWQSITVIRNDPAEVKIRLSMVCLGSTYDLYRNQLDIRLRRGARWVECNWVADDAHLGTVQRHTPDNSNGEVGGLTEQNSAGAAKWWIQSAKTVSKTPAIGKLYLTTARTSFPFALGWQPAGPLANDDYDAHQMQYLGELDETQMVVGR